MLLCLPVKMVAVVVGVQARDVGDVRIKGADNLAGVQVAKAARGGVRPIGV